MIPKLIIDLHAFQIFTNPKQLNEIGKSVILAGASGVGVDFSLKDVNNLVFKSSALSGLGQRTLIKTFYKKECLNRIKKLRPNQICLQFPKKHLKSFSSKIRLDIKNLSKKSEIILSVSSLDCVRTSKETGFTGIEIDASHKNLKGLIKEAKKLNLEVFVRGNLDNHSIRKLILLPIDNFIISNGLLHHAASIGLGQAVRTMVSAVGAP